VEERLSDVELQAYLDGELTAEEARAVEARLETSEACRRKYEVLKAAKEALDLAAPEESTLPVEVEARLEQDLDRRMSRVVPLWIQASLAAAVILFILVLVFKPDGDRESKDHQARNPQDQVLVARAENRLLRMTFVKEKKAATLLHDVVFTLELEPKQKTFNVMLPAREPGQSPEALAEAVAKAMPEMPEPSTLPLAVDLKIHTPAGRRYEGRLCYPNNAVPFVALTGVGGKTSWTFRLSDVFVATRAPVPYMVAWERAGGDWKADQMELFRRFEADPVPVEGKKDHRWERYYPVEAGSYRLEVTVAGLSRRHSWPEVKEPLRAALNFRVSGVVGEWGPEVEGLKLRLAVPNLAYPKGKEFPIVVQILNSAKIPRRYNFMGTTLAEIPQPYHFRFFLDDDLEAAEVKMTAKEGFIFSGRYGFGPHRPGTLKTLVVPASWWTRSGKPLNAAAGLFKLRCRFHFEPTSVPADDPTYWMGELEAPPVHIQVGSGG